MGIFLGVTCAGAEGVLDSHEVAVDLETFESQSTVARDGCEICMEGDDAFGNRRSRWRLPQIHDRPTADGFAQAHR
jgi:tryptophanase